MKEAQHGSVLPDTRHGRWQKAIHLFRNFHPKLTSWKKRKHEARLSQKDKDAKRTSLMMESYPSVKIIHVQGEDSLASASDTVPTFISWDSCLTVDEDELTLSNESGPFENSNKGNCLQDKNIERSANKQIVVPPFVLRQREQQTHRPTVSSQSLAIERVLVDRKAQAMKKTRTSDLQSDLFFCCV